MVAVERVKEYTELESEADWDSIDCFKPNKDWPNSGRIDFCDYTTSYGPELDSKALDRDRDTQKQVKNLSNRFNSNTTSFTKQIMMKRVPQIFLRDDT
jgi:hypothetical protein